MAYFSILSLFLLHTYVAISSTTTCQVTPRLMVMKPQPLILSEAGSTEIWDPNSGLFQCARVQLIRYVIEPNGLVLPAYTNSDRLYYCLQGKAILGLVTPGCSQKSNGEKNECQRILRFQKGDLIALRSEDTIWIYNDDNEPNIIIVLSHITDPGGWRKFAVAGSKKILNGFSLKFIREAFNINDELTMKLQNEDLRGAAAYVTDGGFHLSSSPNTQPCPRQDELETKGLSDVVDESFCNINKRITNISNPLRADLIIPKVGYFKTIDAQQLHILKWIQLSATYHLLQKDVMRLPHWENSYSILYMLKGEGQIQVVDENGKNVFDGVVKEGQLLVVPKSFVMTELAKSKILEYIIFKTSANPITSDLSGKNSVIHELPLEVVTNAYNITKEEAQKMKFGRKEMSLAKVMPKYS